MSTWQLLSDTGDNFRWIQLSDEPKTDEQNAAPTQQPRQLPSISDLLVKGYSKINEGNIVENCGSPMFRTASGKPVLVKQSSLSEASAILGDVVADQKCSKSIGNGVRQLKSPSMFRNRVGKSLALKQTSTSKASSPLCDEGQLSEINSGCILANSMFQTGSGKAVSLSISGLARAQKLLGLDDNQTHRGFEETLKQSYARPFSQQSKLHLSTKKGVIDKQLKDSTSSLITPVKVMSGTSVSELLDATPDNMRSVSKPSSIKFHTAGGRSVSVSSDALQRARSLLGDPELGSLLNEGGAGEPVFSIFKDRTSDENLSKENRSDTCASNQETLKGKRASKNFISPLRSTSSQKQSLVSIGPGKNLIRNFDAEAHESPCYNDAMCVRKYPGDKCFSPHLSKENSFSNGIGLRSNPLKKPPGWPLVDISNTINTSGSNKKPSSAVKRILGRTSSGSSFKRPRVSKFITPLTNEISSVSNGSSVFASEESYKNKVSCRYPVQAPRKYVEEYFGVPPCTKTTLDHLPECIRIMNPDKAEQHCFPDECGSSSIGREAFSHMLLQSGASMKHISETWVSNHYKWIVWKLACYERHYPGRYLTVSNVMEELKYRYEREVNHGHRSAIKRILEGDASPSSVLVLCISSVKSNTEAMVENISTSDGVNNSTAANVELTDGWYSVNAVLDVQLSKKLASGKLFVGQKLKISGAGLCGWAGPVSPLEASMTASLVLHINGTYRTRWSDRLGFCKSECAPLAFSCIKSGGGAVPSTLVGVQRIYPVLYRERLSDGEYTIRSKRMEAKMLQLYHQRRSDVAEGVMSELQRPGADFHVHSDDSEEAAKIFKILETAAEPDILMAEMSSEQLNSLSIYQAKLEATRQLDMHKSIEKALEDSGLCGRDVTPFMRLSVVGLTSKNGRKKCYLRKGLITIWNPTEQQQSELVEGQAYAISGLVALKSESDTLYLQGQGLTTKWLRLSPSAIEHFQPFINPRKPISLYNLNGVPLTCEFDIAGLVIFVGEVYTVAHQRKQWVFVTDCSVHESHSKRPSNNLLAISFSSPYTGHDSYAPINYNLAGSTVGFLNLVMREKDHMNHLLVAEASENSDYSLTYEHIQYTHLKDAAVASQKWAEVSSLIIEKLKRKVLSIIGNCK